MTTCIRHLTPIPPPWTLIFDLLSKWQAVTAILKLQCLPLMNRFGSGEASQPEKIKAMPASRTIEGGCARWLTTRQGGRSRRRLADLR